MSFKFRLEVNLKLAKQELEKAQVLLAQEFDKLQQIEEVYQTEQKILRNAFQDQEKAGYHKPQTLGAWHTFSNYQKQKLEEIFLMMQKQKEIVLRQREALKYCKIKTEKFKRLRSKRWQEYYGEQLRKEQLVIDEIAQLFHG